nr:hypothetical protein [Tanacetum cinerariifolium]
MAAGLSEMELKKILIEKIESNKSIYRSDEQRNLYKALVDAYESNKIILDTYGDIVTLKRRRDDADKDEEPSAGSDWDESAPAEEPIRTTKDLEEPSHQEFETGVADDQPIAEASQHPEWFQQQKKPTTFDCAWNKNLPATLGSIQPWISDLAKQADSLSLFNGLMDTLVDFSTFLMNRLKVDTLTSKLVAGPTYELMKGSCKNISSRLLVDRKSVELLTFTPTMRDSTESIFIIADRRLTPHYARYQVFNPLNVPIICCLSSKTTGKSTEGSKSHQKTASESAPADEPMQTTQDLEEPSHQDFKTDVADDQPITEASQHPEWFQK